MESTPRHLRPRGLGEIIETALDIYRQNYETFVIILTVVQIPVAVLTALLQVAAQSLNATDLGDSARATAYAGQVCGVCLLLVVLVAAVIVAEALMSGATAHASGRAFLGAVPEAGPAYNSVAGRLLTLVGATLLFGLVFFLISITVIGIPVAIWLSVRWSFFIQAIVLEGMGATQALSRSSELVKGSWWRVLGILIVVGLAQGIVFGVINGVLGRVVGLGIDDPTASLIATGVLGAVATVLIGAFVPIVQTVLYYDLRIRREGLGAEPAAQ